MAGRIARCERKRAGDDGGDGERCEDYAAQG